MEPSPALGASRASSLRPVGFLLTVVGALLAGVGASLTWVTVGVEGVSELDSVTKGVDTWDGRVTLTCAVLMLLSVLGTRIVSSDGVRRTLASLVIAAGFISLAVGAAFVMTATTRFAEPGAFTQVGPGPYGAIAGGLAGVIGGVLVLSWASRTSETDELAGASTPASSEGPDD